MAPFDWFRRRPAGTQGSPDIAWRVWLDGGLLQVESSRGDAYHATLEGARAVRVVPLSGGSHHVNATGWQVTLARADGDVLLGPPLPAWQWARELADQVCEATRLPLDELTRGLFSRVGSVKF